MDKDRSSRPSSSSWESRSSPPRPLIDQAKNEWRPTPSSSSFRPRPHSSSMYLLLKGPKLRRILYVWLVLLFTYGYYRLYYQPSRAEHSALISIFDDASRMRHGWFGVNARPDFADFEMLRTLEQEKIPLTGKEYEQASAQHKKRRLIFIGDIHGCVDELQALLKKLSHSPSTDHLVSTGDMVAKGPSSSAVLSLLSSHSASCVRGNHDDRVLLAHASLHSPHQIPLPGPDEDPTTTADDMGEHSHSHGDYRARRLASSLSDENVAFLKTCPVILELGGIKGLTYSSTTATTTTTIPGEDGGGGGDDDSGTVRVVHAGLVPGMSASRQDPYLAMNMRTLDGVTLMPSEKRHPQGSSSEQQSLDGPAIPWYKVWDTFQAKLPKRQRGFVIYGHDAKTGVRKGKYSVGLDGGCVRGGSLNALVVEGARGGVKSKIVRVKCRDRRGER